MCCVSNYDLPQGIPDLYLCSDVLKKGVGEGAGVPVACVFFFFINVLLKVQRDLPKFGNLYSPI